MGEPIDLGVGLEDARREPTDFAAAAQDDHHTATQLEAGLRHRQLPPQASLGIEQGDVLFVDDERPTFTVGRAAEPEDRDENEDPAASHEDRSRWLAVLQSSPREQRCDGNAEQRHHHRGGIKAGCGAEVESRGRPSRLLAVGH